jgi:hypothetical protein
MVGWMILFALMAVAVSITAVKIASLLFALLFLLILVTRAVRDQAH